MKRIFLILLFFSVCGLYAQSGWFWQNPLPQGNTLSDLQFFSISTGYCLSFNSVLKTTNSGTNWQLITTGQNSALVSMYFLNALSGFILCDSGKVLRTSNAGANWSVISDIHLENANRICFVNSFTGFVIFGLINTAPFNTSLYKTFDGGVTWSLIFSDPDHSVVDMKYLPGGTGFCAGNSISNYVKSYRTINFGNTWDTTSQPFYCRLSGISFIDNNTGFLYGYSYSQPSIYKTTNSGLNWLSINCIGSISSLSLLDINNGFAVKNDSILIKSTDTGANWLTVGTIYPDYYGIRSMTFLNLNTGYVSGSAGRICYTSNAGLSWSYQTGGYYSDLFCSKFLNSNTGFAGGNGILLKTTNGGTNWVKQNYGSINQNLFYSIEFIDDNTGFAAGSYMYKTTNQGTNWQIVTGFPGGTIIRICFPTPGTGFAFADFKLYRTTDLGSSWQLISSSLPQYVICGYFLNELTGFTGSTGFQRTTDGGLNWQSMSIGYVNDVKFVDNNTGFALGSHIFKTTDSGNTWFEKALNSDGLYSLGFVNSNTGFAGGYNGQCYKTTDGGESWHRTISNTNNIISSISFVNNQTGFLFGSGGTILKTTTGGEPIGLQPISSEIPNRFVLQQNYPNPFNPTTKIRFSLPNPSEGGAISARLVIYDITGRQVAVLLNEILKPGEYEVEWDGSVYSSGVYFYRVVVGDATGIHANNTNNGVSFTQTKKMVLLK